MLKGDAKAEQLVKDSTALIARLDELEAKFHNPKAEVVYDILAMHGGAKLYSRMLSVFDTVKDTDGLPTQGAREVFADQKRELDQYETELRRLIETELASLNALARKLDLPHIIAQ
jgi:hypothetical protein